LVALAEPSLFTPQQVAFITAVDHQHWATPTTLTTLAFGRHFAASVDRQTVLAVLASQQYNLHVAADSEWEHREGILSWTNIISHLSDRSSSSSSLPTTTAGADRLSPRQAAEAFVTLLRLVAGGWRLSTVRTAHDSWRRLEGDDEVMLAVGRALRDVVCDSEETREQVKCFEVSRKDRERQCTVVERSLAEHNPDDPLLAFFRSLKSQ
jgi:hypothetical protein